MERYSGLYLIGLFFLVYALIEPSQFLTTSNLRSVVSQEAITGILTLGLMVSLVSGVFDLSIGANMSWAIMFVAWLQSNGHVPWSVAIILTLLSGAVIGVANAVVVTGLKVDSVIGTLGMSSILAAATYWISGGQSIVSGISSTFIQLGSGSLWTIPLPVYYFAVIAVVLWYVLNHTPTGRYLYAVGGNVSASRLAGLRVVKLQWIGLVSSAVVASLAGVVFTAAIGSASFDAGTPYLLPAFAAAFLGATQIRPGRFNVWGTVIAIYLLAIGINGLQLKWPGEPWIQNLFEGVVLIVAVALAARSARRRVGVRSAS
jgi:ribose transport system permease protein